MMLPVETLRQIREAQAINAQLARELREHERQWFERYREQDAVIHELQSTLHRLLGATSQYRLQIIPSDDAEYELAHELDAAIAAASATRGSASLPNPDPVESDRQSSESRGLEASSARRVEVEACWCCGYPAPLRGDDDPWEGRMDGYCACCSSTRCDTTDSTCMHGRSISATAALPPPESGSSGSGSASALEVEAGGLFDGSYAPLLEQAETRVYTNELDALEALITEGLPAEEMQAAAWVLVQRVRGLHDDLKRVAKEASYPLERLTFYTDAHATEPLASATKPEASPSPENELQDAEIGAAIRPRVEVSPAGFSGPQRWQYLICEDGRNHTVFASKHVYHSEESARAAGEASLLGPTVDEILTSTTTAEPSPIPESSRPVSTDREEDEQVLGDRQEPVVAEVVRAAQAVSDYWFEALACEDCEDADGWCNKHFEMCQPTMEALRSALASGGDS